MLHQHSCAEWLHLHHGRLWTTQHCRTIGPETNQCTVIAPMHEHRRDASAAATLHSKVGRTEAIAVKRNLTSDRNLDSEEYSRVCQYNMTSLLGVVSVQISDHTHQ